MASGKYDGLTQFGWLLKEVWIECGPSPMPCKLDKMLGRLNGYGPAWALGNVPVVVAWMAEHAKNKGMEFSEAVASGIVRRLAERVLHDSGRMEKAVDGGKEQAAGGEASAVASQSGSQEAGGDRGEQSAGDGTDEGLAGLP